MAIEKLDGYVKPSKVNPYIAELEGMAVGDVFAITAQTRISENTGKVLGLTGERVNVQEAARAHGMTARILEETVLSEPTPTSPGEVRFVFELRPMQKGGPRGPRKPRKSRQSVSES